MTRQELETQIDQIARRFAEGHDEWDKREIESLSLQLADLRRLGLLEDALGHGLKAAIQ